MGFDDIQIWNIYIFIYLVIFSVCSTLTGPREWGAAASGGNAQPAAPRQQWTKPFSLPLLLRRGKRNLYKFSLPLPCTMLLQYQETLPEVHVSLKISRSMLFFHLWLHKPSYIISVITLLLSFPFFLTFSDNVSSCPVVLVFWGFSCCYSVLKMAMGILW